MVGFTSWLLSCLYTRSDSNLCISSRNFYLLAVMELVEYSGINYELRSIVKGDFTAHSSLESSGSVFFRSIHIRVE